MLGEKYENLKANVKSSNEREENLKIQILKIESDHQNEQKELESYHKDKLQS